MESDRGDKEFKSDESVPKLSIGTSLLLNRSGSEPMKSLPSPESGEPRESGMSEKRSGVLDSWKISSQSITESSGVMDGQMSSTLGTSGSGTDRGADCEAAGGVV